MSMKNLLVTLFLAVLAILTVIGCGEDPTKPVVTRLFISEKCGVAPLRLEFRADASGGVPQENPTGGNNFLRMDWDFGDGTTVSDGTSIFYHTYENPGVYEVKITAVDSDGEQASLTDTVYVFSDSLEVGIFSIVEDPITGDIQTTHEVDACQDIRFLISAAACDFDSVTGYYERFLYVWEMQDDSAAVYFGPQPSHRFPPGNAGDHDVRLILEDPGRSITRNQLYPVVVNYEGADLEVRARWDAPNPDTLVVPRGLFPTTYEYNVDLANRGPDPGYHVRVTGLFPEGDESDYGIENWAASIGEFSHADDDSIWVWNIPYLPAHANEFLTIDLAIADAVPDTHEIFNQIEYVCDDDPFDNAYPLQMRVRAADLRVQAGWAPPGSSNPTFDYSEIPDDADSTYVISDVLTTIFRVANDGPEDRPTDGSAPFTIQGEIPAADSIVFSDAYVTITQFGATNRLEEVVQPDLVVEYDAATRLWSVDVDTLGVIFLVPPNQQSPGLRFLHELRVHSTFNFDAVWDDVAGIVYTFAAEIIPSDYLDTTTSNTIQARLRIPTLPVR